MATMLPVMTPPTGERLLRFVGDRLWFGITDRAGRPAPPGWRAVLRTNLGRAHVLRREILQAHARGVPVAGASWRDIPMLAGGGGWEIDLPLAEPGFFKAKAYLVDQRGWQHWPEGPDIGITVHPDRYRTANILYGAFARMFGETRTRGRSADPQVPGVLRPFDEAGYTIIPPSGKLRDLAGELPHIFQTLGCRILHLLPVNPTPTTYARYGRYGSPYAALDLTAIDPALVVFDKRTTGVDQFRELTYATHLLGGRVFLDIVINHTGWGSVLQENHPEWFLRQQDGTFVSPGAWGVTWEDLVELKHENVALWDALAEMFLTWCRRGVDGFRCDAGYKVPVAAWQYIVARVEQEYPETIFFLEGLGGAWEATAALLTEGGMQWAYSELFQNYLPVQVSGYLDHSLRQSERVGLLIHYSETHDNERLAARGRAWSLLRNRLCALASPSGGFGFTCGVEWLADEKIRVHGSTGMRWGSAENIIPELARLDRLLAEHPCFFDGAGLKRLSRPEAPVYALLRTSREGKDTVLVLVNTDPERAQRMQIDAEPQLEGLSGWSDLLGQNLAALHVSGTQQVDAILPPGAAYCLAPTAQPIGLSGDSYRLARAQAAWALSALSQVRAAEQIGELDWRWLAEQVARSPFNFLAALSELPAQVTRKTLAEALNGGNRFPRVVAWNLEDVRRVTPVPPNHFLLIEDSAPFRACLDLRNGSPKLNVESISVPGGQVAFFPPRVEAAETVLSLERYAPNDQHPEAAVRFLPAEPEPRGESQPLGSDIVLLTNGRGGMARMCVDLGLVTSKYDCVLGANLHPSLPVDRHVFVKRIRLWVNADGFLSPLSLENLRSFRPGPPATWHFVANAGDGRTVEIDVCASMLRDCNSTVFRFARPTAAQASGKQLPPEADVRLTVRVGMEDRSFHDQTRYSSGAEHHFSSHTRSLARPGTGKAPGASEAEFAGFSFTPAPDRQLRVYSDAGSYHAQPEWSLNIAHPVEQSRGQVESGDAYSPGWFEIPLPRGAKAALVVTAEPPPNEGEVLEVPEPRPGLEEETPAPARDVFAERLLESMRAFLVRRDHGKTVIAGYPWFLDWGRDTFICARGLIAAGMVEEVKQLLVTFGSFEKDGTLPNTIFGTDASNRDTSDAPLWYGLVLEELSAVLPEVYRTPVGNSGRTLLDVVESIGRNYVAGTPNGIRMDPQSALVWSPSHFTWMDTNYPACTPREGYPVEVQALWVRLLRQLSARQTAGQQEYWGALADKASDSLERLFWSDVRGCYGDVLLARSGRSAENAVRDDALRSNYLFLVSLGLIRGGRAKRSLWAALRHLVVPGALRTLAPLPVALPLPIYSPDGRLLNNPSEPYWGHYAGEEDTRRKPAYHNGTAWTWTLPVFCEALARAWDFEGQALAAAKAYLGSMGPLLDQGCLGHLPEVLDGDAPHTQRGCDAQAWAATEAFRVWKLLAYR